MFGIESASQPEENLSPRERRILPIYGIAALALLGWLLIRYLDGADRPIEWVLSICVINFLVVTPELWLRETGN